MKFWLIRIGSFLAVVAFLFGLEAMLGVVDNDYFRRLVLLGGLYVTLAVSLNLINGITGQFSIGHAAFYHIGAYTTGYISTTYFRSTQIPELMWLLMMLGLGAIFAAIAGFVVGLPSLRLKGDYLAIVTLGFGEIIRIVTTNIQEVGGSSGFTLSPKIEALWLVWLLAIVCIAVSRNLLRTAHGLPFLSVREDEFASASMGVNVTRVKVTAFIIGSAFAGAAGVLFAHYESFLTPDMFKMDVSFIILTMVVLGGTGSITGSALAALALFGIPEWLRTLKNPDGGAMTITNANLIGAVVVIIIAVYVLRKIGERFHGSNWAKTGIVTGVIVGAIVMQQVLSYGFGLVPILGPEGSQYRIEAFRMAIFAATLIIVMLLRPQGIFAHHEFSWDWLRSLFSRKKPSVEASS